MLKKVFNMVFIHLEGRKIFIGSQDFSDKFSGHEPKKFENPWVSLFIGSLVLGRHIVVCKLAKIPRLVGALCISSLKFQKDGDKKYQIFLFRKFWTKQSIFRFNCILNLTNGEYTYCTLYQRI